MSKEGKIIRNVRADKNFSLNTACQDDLSAAALSKFEHGESNLASSSFLKVLDNMRVDVSEFNYIYTDGDLSYYRELDQKSLDAVNNGNERLLQNYADKEMYQFEKSNDNRHKINSIVIKSYIAKLRNEGLTLTDRNYITDYLFMLEYWGEYELLVLWRALSILDSKTLDLLLQEILSDDTVLANTGNTQNIRINLLIAALQIMVERTEIKYSEKYLLLINVQYKDNINFIENIFAQILLKSCEAAHFYQIGEIDKSRNLIQQVLKTLLYLGDENNYVQIKSFYENVCGIEIE